ncbi:bifunctional hydroxymethylpyrimidine kinase/phosphomethylpyrimidine kinase [Sphingomonas sp. S1-29]|uniref:bifunctional hydroxymethylpyrimidine kinase/phosphomethylpyrimidine kinase n=1 Tax=Sphingomonas sp. S1-29 TaxID=2991074 RepID=UPI00224022E9|nr:bifunctional hydroxymethylpyrimidine kinase/phosphomethylpyrimidine kinase [Sphingomonas sp. S1-29]UZK68980.1 bifunctional hydroxymethylpyrimidine kinase/phosphomethylpyrimidine kinase [Sphingomonas sp. S1-29]
MNPPRILIVAGSDSGGGAGIQADIKTATMLGCHAMTAITAITAQNTLGVDAVHPIPTDMVMAQVDCVIRDIGVDAVKIGMIGSARTAAALAERLAEMPGLPIVFDPVMIATSGATLADDATIAAFARLMRVATVTTPNLPELKALSGMSILDKAAQRSAARSLVQRRGSALLVKGGHAKGRQVTDRLFQQSEGTAPEIEWTGSRLDGEATHGTGCTLSTAIACELAKDWTLPEAIGRARRFVRIAIQDAADLGQGHGPMAQQAVRLDLNQSRWSPMLNHVTVPANGLGESEHFYRLLGLRQIVRSDDRYARFETEGGATLSIEVEQQLAAPVIYLECGDLDVTVPYLKAQGLSFVQEPTDEKWGWREARLVDPAGNTVCLYQAGEMRRFPPWRIGDA